MDLGFRGPLQEGSTHPEQKFEAETKKKKKKNTKKEKFSKASVYATSHTNQLPRTVNDNESKHN
jgi:hypothetical protein